MTYLQTGFKPTYPRIMMKVRGPQLRVAELQSEYGQQLRKGPREAVGPIVTDIPSGRV